MNARSHDQSRRRHTPHWRSNHRVIRPTSVCTAPRARATRNRPQKRAYTRSHKAPHHMPLDNHRRARARPDTHRLRPRRMCGCWPAADRTAPALWFLILLSSSRPTTDHDNSLISTIVVLVKFRLMIPPPAIHDHDHVQKGYQGALGRARSAHRCLTLP